MIVLDPDMRFLLSAVLAITVLYVYLAWEGVVDLSDRWSRGPSVVPMGCTLLLFWLLPETLLPWIGVPCVALATGLTVWFFHHWGGVAAAGAASSVLAVHAATLGALTLIAR